MREVGKEGCERGEEVGICEERNVVQHVYLHGVGKRVTEPVNWHNVDPTYM